MPATRCHFQHGFTLLELMVVVVIAALLFTFVALSINPNTAEDNLKQEALRFNRLLQLLLEEAVLKGEDYGIEFAPREYRFLRLEQNQWTPIENDKILRKRKLPEEMEMDLAVENTSIVIDNTGIDGEKDNRDAIKPQVFVLSSGEITPELELQLYYPTLATRYAVRAQFDGKHSTTLLE